MVYQYYNCKYIIFSTLNILLATQALNLLNKHLFNSNFFPKSLFQTKIIKDIIPFEKNIKKKRNVNARYKIKFNMQR